MTSYPPTVILRHRRENLKKCSLRGLEMRSDFKFFTYPKNQLPPLEGYLILSFEGPQLSAADAGRGLFLLDATWRHAAAMERFVERTQPFLLRRSLPEGLRTAYPRRQEDCAEPDRGLASAEALYAAYVFLGRDPSGILDHYHWRERFLLDNLDLLTIK